MSKKCHDINWLYQNHMIAWDRLPECYQEDNCLEFWFEGCRLYAAPKDSEKQWVGDWVAEYNPKFETWNVSWKNNPY